jgi:hypothetical protein
VPPPFRLRFTDRAAADLAELKRDPGRAKRFKAVQKTLGLLETNPRHPGLQTHEHTNLKGAGGEKVFEAYAEHRTPAAYRVFWYYGPEKRTIVIVAITPHP